MLAHAAVILRALKTSGKVAMAALLNNKKVTCNLRDVIPFLVPQTMPRFLSDLKKTETR